VSRGRTPVALTLALALLVAATSAKAQQAGSPRIGWLGLPAQAANADLIAGFREGLRELGYTEGKNLIIDYRFAEGQSELLGHLAVELVGLPVNAIVVTSAPAAIAAAPPAIDVTGALRLLFVVSATVRLDLATSCAAPARMAAGDLGSATPDVALTSTNVPPMKSMPKFNPTKKYRQIATIEKNAEAGKLMRRNRMKSNFVSSGTIRSIGIAE